MSLRIAFIGCVESSRAALQALLSLPGEMVQVVGLMTRQASSFNTDFVDLSPLARQHGLPILNVKDAATDADQAEWLQSLRPDLVFCVGWSRLLGDRVLKAASGGVVGFHPAALPANRGRHPLIWALVLGLKETASSFFLMQHDADSGPLLSQQKIDIADEDDAASLYNKILAVMPGQIISIVHGLANQSLIPQPQDAALANHWRKRTAADGQIDWRMSAEGIYNLVRALAKPYPGAHFLHRNEAVKLWKCEVVQTNALNFEPGKILEVEGRSLTVKCGFGCIRLLDHELASTPPRGHYL